MGGGNDVVLGILEIRQHTPEIEIDEPRLRVDVIFCPPIDPYGLSRRELAARSRTAIADALGLAAAEADPNSNTVRRAA